jgi:hypothetical protein
VEPGFEHTGGGSSQQQSYIMKYIYNMSIDNNQINVYFTMQKKAKNQNTKYYKENENKI